MTIGVVLVNLGTPDAPTPQAVRKYLYEFLSDPRVVRLPRFIVWLIVWLRAGSSAKLYQNIWTPEGSPLRVISVQQTKKLQHSLGSKVKVILGMRYGNPSIKSALAEFEKLNITDILILPLYPQYSDSTTGSVIDVVPAKKIIRDYHDDKNYIQAIANTLKNITTQKILFSFHGLPQKYVDEGDVYFDQCHESVRRIAQLLKLPENKYAIAFQSRVGRAPWLQPYTDELLKKWAKDGVESVSVVCPGFAADCLETLEEINIRYRALFLEAGGKLFNYIPALNSTDEHIEVLAKLIQKNIQGVEND